MYLLGYNICTLVVWQHCVSWQCFFEAYGFIHSCLIDWFDFLIQEAHGLTPTDDQSLTSDPYIKLTLLPEKKYRVKTRVLRKTLDPAFEETFSFYGIPLARVSELALHFMVLSFDRFSRDEVIGETLVPLSGIDLSEGRVLMSREIIKKNVKVRSGTILPEPLHDLYPFLY